MATFVCRVQFLDDTDPFNSTNFPEPTRPPLYTFREDIPLINQIAGVHRLLKAPQKVCNILFKSPLLPFYTLYMFLQSLVKLTTYNLQHFKLMISYVDNGYYQQKLMDH